MSEMEPMNSDSIQKLRDFLERQEIEIDALELLAHSSEEAEKNPKLNQKVEEYHVEVESFYRCVDQIHKMGCVIKDLELGLVDFYAIYQDHIVFLCWRLGEKEIGYWHEIGRGYPDRKPLEWPKSSS